MALSANESTLLRDGRQFEYGLKAQTNPTKIYQGSFVQLDGNYIEKATAGANRKYAGVILEEATSGATDGAAKAQVRRRTAVHFKTISTGRNTVPGIGDTAYLHDENTVTGTNDVATANTVDRTAVGAVVDADDDGVWVYFE